MLTIDEYKKLFPNENVWTSRDPNRIRTQYESRIVIEGMLQFTPESAPCWGGPFEGGYAYCSILDWSQTLYGMRKGPFYNKNYLEVWEQKAKESFERRKRSIFATRVQKEAVYDPEAQRLCPQLPFVLGICGDDDTSYSKYFASEIEAMDELMLFANNEPLVFTEVVHDFKFTFTN